MDDENEIETLKRIRMLARVRQQNYYKKHKVEINAKRRQIYANGKAKSNPQQEEEGYEQENDQYEEPLEKEVYKTDFSNSRSASYEDIVNALNTVVINASSRDKYKQDVKRLLVLTKCENFIKCLKDYKKIIDIINNSTKQNGDAYSVNTKKALYQMIIYLIDKLHLPISTKIKQQYIQQFEVYKINSNDETIQKQETTQIPSFSDYLQNIKNEYGIE